MGKSPADVRGAVLLVEDDDLVARSYARTLRKAGYGVAVACDAETAVAMFRERQFDVIVSDIKMPGMGGLELLRTVREHDVDVPVIMMTADPNVESAIKAMEHGAFRFLGKPVELSQLLNVVARALRLHQLARVRREALEEYGAQGGHLGDRADMDVRFDRALAGLWMAYQPIVSCGRRSIHAYEALVRTDEPSLRNPSDLFDVAERLNRVHELGQAIRRHVAGTLVSNAPPLPVFVNVHPEDLRDDSLLSPQSPLSAFAGQVVLEITERAALDTVGDLLPRMARLRSMGFRIALDDLGAGHASLTSFAQLEPEIVKVDMSIVRGLEISATKQKLMGSLVTLCRDLDIQIVAEGIETASERDAVVGLGGDLCQGYLFARPGRPFPTANFAE